MNKENTSSLRTCCASVSDSLAMSESPFADPLSLESSSWMALEGGSDSSESLPVATATTGTGLVFELPDFAAVRGLELEPIVKESKSVWAQCGQ